jgi:hypothetical protein
MGRFHPLTFFTSLKVGTKFPKINPNLHGGKGAFLFTGTETQNRVLQVRMELPKITLIYTPEKGAFPFSGTETQNLALSENEIVKNNPNLHGRKGAFLLTGTETQNLALSEKELPKT